MNKDPLVIKQFLRFYSETLGTAYDVNILKYQSKHK